MSARRFRQNSSMIQWGFFSALSPVFRNLYALEPVVHPDTARNAGGSRGGQSPVAVAGRLHSAAGFGNIQLLVSRQTLATEDRAHRPRGDGLDRSPGIPSARTSSRRAVAAEWTLGGHGLGHVSAPRPLGTGPVPGYDRGRGDDLDRPRRAEKLQATAPALVSDPGQVPRRAAAQVRVDEDAPVHDEGLLLL